MIILYIWLGVVGFILLMLVAKLILKLALLFKRQKMDWSAYNSTILSLTAIAFFPIALLLALARGTK